MSEPRPPASAVIESLGPKATKADQIRALNVNGYSRSEIAEVLGLRYQHVRNVLVDDERLKRAPERVRGMAESERPFEHASDVIGRIVVGKNGKLTLPREMLEAIGAKDGDALLVRARNKEIRLITPDEATNRARALVRPFVQEGVSLADELIAERRAEATRELEDE